MYLTHLSQLNTGVGYVSEDHHGAGVKQSESTMLPTDRQQRIVDLLHARDSALWISSWTYPDPVGFQDLEHTAL